MSPPRVKNPRPHPLNPEAAHITAATRMNLLLPASQFRPLGTTGERQKRDDFVQRAARWSQDVRRSALHVPGRPDRRACCGDPEPLAHSERVAAGLAPRRAGEADQLEHLIDSSCGQLLASDDPQQMMAFRPAELQRGGVDQRADAASSAAVGTPTADSLNMLASWAATAEQTGKPASRSLDTARSTARC